MTFAQAKKKLKEIAGDEYHTVQYELKEYREGKQVTECTLYIHGHTHHEGPTWDDAFRSLDIAMNPPKVDASEQPKGQA